MDQSSYEFKLESIRRQVDQVDTDLYEILQKRFQLTNLIGELKKEHNSIEMCETRKKQIVNRLRDKALKDGISINLLESLYNLIINQSVVDQSTIIKDK